MGDHGDQHAGQENVLRELRRAVGLGRAVLAFGLLADQAEILGVFEFDLSRDGFVSRIERQFTEAGLAATAGMADDAIAHGNLRRADIPPLGRSRNQHGPPGGAGLAHLVPGIGHRRAAAGTLSRAPEGVVVALGIGRGAFDANMRPISIQLVGQDGRQAGVGALPHFEVLGHDGHAVVGTDFQKRVNFRVDRGNGAHFSGRGGGHHRQAEAQRQAGTTLQETAAAEVFNNDFAHDLSPQASALAAS